MADEQIRRAEQRIAHVRDHHGVRRRGKSFRRWNSRLTVILVVAAFARNAPAAGGPGNFAERRDGAIGA